MSDLPTCAFDAVPALHDALSMMSGKDQIRWFKSFVGDMPNDQVIKLYAQVELETMVRKIGEYASNPATDGVE